MTQEALSEEMKAALAFTGNFLSPFYLIDPRIEQASRLVDDVAKLDAEEVSREWPFGDADKIKAAFQLMIQGSHQDREALSWEFRRLFVGPQKKAAPPWGSVYMDHEGVMYGNTTIDLRDWMRAHGVKKTIDQSMPEDHLGYMLMLMAYLAENHPADVAEYLQLHVLTWTSHYLELLNERTTHDFYHGLACLTQLNLEAIEQELDLDVVIPRFYR